MAQYRQPRLLRDRAARWTAGLAGSLRQRGRDGVSSRRQRLDFRQRRRRDHRHQPQRLDRLVALVHRARQEADLRLVGTGAARTFLDLMHATGAALGIEPNIAFIDIPPDLRPNYQYFTEAKMNRLRQAGYNAPFTPLEDAVRDCVVNHLATGNPYL